MLSVGLMSGTSMDGIDAALLETDGTPAFIRELGHVSLEYDPPFKILLKATEYSIRKAANEAIQQHTPEEKLILNRARGTFLQDVQDYLRTELSLSPQEIEDRLIQLEAYLPLTLDAVVEHSTYLHGQAVLKLLEETNVSVNNIDVVGCHGQTFFHRPSAKLSIILNNGQALATQTGIAVVNDFRRQDIELGGQGAPFAPLYHQALAVRDGRLPCAVVNCGGISNITLIRSENEQDLLGFDVGPGNGLIDRLVRQRTRGQETMDKDGGYGSRGVVHPAVLSALQAQALDHSGRSLDIGDLQLIPELDSLSLEDACATLEAFTADTIAQCLGTENIPQQWVLAGGGWRNPVILNELEQRLRRRRADVQIHLADGIGWSGVAMEAQIFAYLAVRSLQGNPLSYPGTTGVPYPVTGGKLFLT